MSIGSKNVSYPTQTGERFILSRPEDSAYRSRIMASGNGNASGNFGVVLAGTALGIITASGKVRPLGRALISGDQSGVNEINLAAGAQAQLFVGDSVNIVGPLGGELGTATAADLDGTPDSGESIDFVSVVKDGHAHVVTLDDPAGDGALSVAVTKTSAGVATIVVTLAQSTNVTSTLNDIINAINSDPEASQYVLASLADGATGTTVYAVGDDTTVTLSGGAAPGTTPQVRVSGRTVSAVDRTSSPPTVTISGGTVDVFDGDAVVLADGSQAPYGYLAESVSTADEMVDHTTTPPSVTYSDQRCVVLWEGIVDENYLYGADATVKAALESRIHHDSPTTWAEV